MDDIHEAARRIAPFIHRTPVLTSSTINQIVGAELFFKCENFQRMGAFKARGAHNAVFSLTPDQLSKGLVTHSSGNHAGAVALAAKSAGTTARIVIPNNASRVKIEAVQRLGGQITFCEPTVEAREGTTRTIMEQTGATLVHPFDDWNVIAGQATASLELVDDVPNLDTLLAPVGGGGLISGTAIVGKHFGIRVVAAEPLGADDAYRSMQAGSIQPAMNVNTVADGLRTSLGQRPFQIIHEQVASVVTTSDELIIKAMRMIWEMMKIIVEPSCAVPLAALLEKRSEVAGHRIGIILSGGNVDLDKLPWVRT